MPPPSTSVAATTHERDEATRAFESTRTRNERRERGIYNTPWTTAVELVSAIDAVGTVCDPSCGTGTLLLAAGERLVALGATRAEAADLLVGIDVDAEAIAVARTRLFEWAGCDTARVIVGDALACDGIAAEIRSDHIVGNPPFVDGMHARFVELAARIARSTIAMIVPRSVLATGNGRAARGACVDAGFGVVSVDAIGPVFDAVIDACAVVLRAGAPAPSGSTWSAFLEPDVPEAHLTGTPLGDVADVVAGFRQHFYGLRGHVRDGGDGLPLVTSGAIAPGEWGGRAVRFDGTRYVDPRVTLTNVEPAVRTWFEALLRPKVLVATQTRVLEAAVDERGETVPSVPVISVVPRDPSFVWHALAVLLAPPVTAWALRGWGGTALSARALKLGAPQVRAAPMPAPSTAWNDAAALLRRGGSVADAGARMCEAYGVSGEVFEWWTARLR